jgi:hypothetical protein
VKGCTAKSIDMKTELTEAEKIPIEHQLKCEGCGKILDMRDPSVICHGWIENGEIVCYDDKEIEYSGSKKLGDNRYYTSSNIEININ